MTFCTLPRLSMGKSKVWICVVLIFFVSSVLSESKKPGKLDIETLESSLPGFQDRFNNYQAQEPFIQQVRSFREFLRIEVYMNMECSRSKELVPAFIKILKLADNPYIEAEYFLLPNDQFQWETYSEGRSISKIPTFIVYNENLELGRIVEKPLQSLEQDLVDILYAAPPPDYSLDYDFFMNNYHADLDVNCSECHLP